MGRDKATIELPDGRRLVELAIDALIEAGASQLVVVGGPPEAAERRSVEIVEDFAPGAGPLGGIVAALDAGRNPVVVILACDLITPSAATVRAVVEALGQSDVAIPVAGGFDQVLHAAWRREAVGHLRQRFDAGERSVVAGVEGLTLVRVSGLAPGDFADADTPADLP